MSEALESSEFTKPHRARLELAFSRSSSEPNAAITRVPEAGSIESRVELYLAAASAWASDAAFSRAREQSREPDYRIDLIGALDDDFHALIGEAKVSRSAEDNELADVLRAWSESAGYLASYVAGAALDPRTRRTAEQDVGPRPFVSVYLYLPYIAKLEPAEDLDVALIFRGGAQADAPLDRLAEAMTPDVLVPPPAIVLQARRNAEARTELLTEYGALTASQVAELSGSEAKNRSALAGRWRREGKLVAVEHHGTVYYPAFQFDGDGKPWPVMEHVLKHLDDPNMTSWQLALWFTTANGWLDGRRPVDLLESEPAGVIAAAREAFREPVG